MPGRLGEGSVCSAGCLWLKETSLAPMGHLLNLEGVVEGEGREDGRSGERLWGSQTR